MKKPGILVFVLTALAVTNETHSGHEIPIYPSYYPQEIRIESVDPVSAAGLLLEAKIHAYVGDEITFEKAIPESIGYVESLGSYIVLTLNPASRLVEVMDTAKLAGATDVALATRKRGPQ